MQTLQKKERLHEKNIILNLFNKGKSFYINSFKILYLNTEFDGFYPVKVLFAVSSRNFKKAVHRNHIKRLMKESFRKNKHLLYDAFANSNKKLVFMILYNEKKLISYEEIENKIILILHRLVKENEKISK